MASEHCVKQYLAYWFQLGKGVVVHKGQEVVLPSPVISGHVYSQEFEACWQQIRQLGGRDCYLEGTSQTISELLLPDWEINSCARCSMPIPCKSLGIASLECPCFDLPTWPNTELPLPRAPIDNQVKLQQICDRLRQNSEAAISSQSE
jgi:hypothetical protein